VKDERGRRSKEKGKKKIGDRGCGEEKNSNRMKKKHEKGAE
jgi:hypothetical protein